MGRGGLIAGGALVLLALVLVWAWYDGGERALSPQESPALLPKVSQ